MGPRSTGNAVSENLEISPALLERGRQMWERLLPQHIKGPLPFLRLDVNDQGEITVASFWDVADTGNKFDDLALGCFYAELLLHRSKNVRGNFDPFQMVWAVLVAVAEEGNPGMIERGFLGRLSMLVITGSMN